MATADSIKAFRRRMQWSQSELAAELGVDQATVSRIENGAGSSRPVRRLLDRLIAQSVACNGDAARDQAPHGEAA